MRRLLLLAPWVAIVLVAWRQRTLEDQTADFALAMTAANAQTVKTVGEQLQVALDGLAGRE